MKTKTTRIGRLLNYLYIVFFDVNIPVWLTLLLTILGAFCAYELAPRLNEKFEIQAARREFIVNNLKEFGTSSKLIIEKVHHIVTAPNGSLSKLDYLEVDGLIAKIQYDAVQLTYILPDKESEVVYYQNSLLKLKVEIENFYKTNNSTDVVAALKKAEENSLGLYAALLESVGFKKPNFQ